MPEITFTPYQPARDGGPHVTTVCDGCGALVVDRATHARFHSVLSSHAWALAVLKTAHLAARVHDQWEVVPKIDSKHFDNWSAGAFAEVVATHGDDV
jgi:hypothetical protein